jgi:hypothetical protein
MEPKQMDSGKSLLATAVPRSSEKRLEITQAIRALVAEHDDELPHRRRPEIASIRRELEQIALTIQKLQRACDPRLRSYVVKFNADQPRVPAGNPDGGQWTSESSENRREKETDVAVRSKPSEAECDAQFERDLEICRMIRSQACYGQAMARYAACRTGRPIPPLVF